MMNLINHVVTIPNHIYRTLENDLENFDDNSKIKRIALATLPYLNLYQPIGKPLSHALNGVRLLSTAKGFYLQRDLAHLFSLTLSVTLAASSFFSFKLGLVVLAALDTASFAIESARHIKSAEYRKAVHSLVHALSNALYLALLLSHSLEIALASALLQGLYSSIEALGEWGKGRRLEAVSKIGLGVISFRQANSYRCEIARRNFLISLIGDHFLKGKDLSSLLSLGEDQQALLLEKEGIFYLHGLGKGWVKGMNLSARHITLNGKELAEIQFKVNHVFREKIGALMQGYDKLLPGDLQEALGFSGIEGSRLTVERNSTRLGGLNIPSSVFRFSLEGVGSIQVGTDLGNPNRYCQVTVQLEKGKNLYELHALLSFLNLHEALKTSTQEDCERMKIGHLFRVFFPAKATPFERGEDFFTLPVEELKLAVIQQEPRMESVLDKYLATMELYEIVAGMKRLKIVGLAKEAEALGARSLTLALTGANEMETIGERVASILRGGVLSAEARGDRGISSDGLTLLGIYDTGSADSVFTQIITQNTLDTFHSADFLQYGGDFSPRFVISLEALETGTYQYHEDNYGSRCMESFFAPIELAKFTELLQQYRPREMEMIHRLIDSLNSRAAVYPTREGILDFVRKEQQQFFYGNEVMLKYRLDPSMIERVVLPSDEMREAVLEAVRKEGLIVGWEGGVETIFGRKTDEFFPVSLEMKALGL